VVRDFLGLTQYRSYHVDWQVFRAMLGDATIVHACDAAIAAACKVAGNRRLAVDRDRLRVLDVALWTYARKLAS
jgi:hypothetical protein